MEFGEQSSWASCELCSHRRRDKTVSSRRRRRCVLGIKQQDPVNSAPGCLSLSHFASVGHWRYVYCSLISSLLRLPHGGCMDCWRQGLLSRTTCGTVGSLLLWFRRRWCRVMHRSVNWGYRRRRQRSDRRRTWANATFTGNVHRKMVYIDIGTAGKPGCTDMQPRRRCSITHVSIFDISRSVQLGTDQQCNKQKRERTNNEYSIIVQHP